MCLSTPKSRTSRNREFVDYSYLPIPRSLCMYNLSLGLPPISPSPGWWLHPPLALLISLHPLDGGFILPLPLSICQHDMRINKNNKVVFHLSKLAQPISIHLKSCLPPACLLSCVLLNSLSAYKLVFVRVQKVKRHSGATKEA
jgi:hypothetical protein